MSDDLILAYATAPDLETAERISNTLVEEKLIACANLLPGMKSIYRWQEKMEKTDEVALLFKTRQALWPDLCSRYRELHPYDTPCLMEIPLERVLDAYKAWLLKETNPGA
jgi:periplasmic divalent cation tolerance protein